MQTTGDALQPDRKREGKVTEWPCIGETPPPSKPIRHLDQNDLARRWRISPRTLERWRWLMQGPAFLRLGGRVAYRIEDVEAYEMARRHHTASACDLPHGGA